MKVRSALYIAVVLLIASFAMAQVPCDPTIIQKATLFVNWPQFQYDPTHSACNPFESILGTATVGNLEIHWIYNGIQGSYVSPVVANGIAYIGSSQGFPPDGNLAAVNVRTGSEIWRLSPTVPITDTPAVAKNVVYVGGGDPGSGGAFYAINASTGKVLWKYGNVNTYFQSSPTVVNGVVYVASFKDASLYAFNAGTGDVIWKDQIGSFQGVFDSSPAVAAGVVYIGSNDHNVYALNAATGAVIWKYATGDEVHSSPVVGQGNVYVSSSDNNTYALNANTGALIWKYGAATGGLNSPALATGILYVGAADGTLYALNAHAGSLLWKSSSPTIIGSPVVANGVVYFGAFNKNIYALDARTGTCLWNYAVANDVKTSLAVANGELYAGTPLYAFRLPGH